MIDFDKRKKFVIQFRVECLLSVLPGIECPRSKYTIKIGQDFLDIQYAAGSGMQSVSLSIPQIIIVFLERCIRKVTFSSRILEYLDIVFTERHQNSELYFRPLFSLYYYGTLPAQVCKVSNETSLQCVEHSHRPKFLQPPMSTC